MARPAPRDLELHEWGSAPDCYGPRHDYRESLMLRQLLPSLPGPRVLNAGCGAGSLSLRMANAGLDVTSVDASEAFVARLAGLMARRHPGRRLPVELADLHALELPDASFDGVTCGEVLEHLDDDRTAMAELARVLAPGGVLVASVPANPWRYDWLDHWAGHRRRYTVEGLDARLREAGFGDVRVTSWGFPLTGVFHRHVYLRVMRRRLEQGADGLGPPGRMARIVSPVLRLAFELDSLFLGRAPGYFGLLAWARR
jgi:SAM-dependent methyltransferase